MRHVILSIPLVSLCFWICYAAAAEHQTKQVRAGKVITLTGTVKRYADQFVRLRTRRGEYDLRWDDSVEKLARNFNGRKVQIKGALTGKVSQDVGASLSSPFSG